MRCAIVMSAACLVSVFAPANGGDGQPPVTIYMATDGLDTNPGTAEAPVATLPRALQLADGQPDPAQIVVRGGTYSLEETVTIRRSSKEGRLVIRSADDETAIFDGSVPVREAEPLEGAPGVYTVEGDFPTDEPPTVWDEETGRHFTKLAALDAVQATNYSSLVLDERTLAIRGRDGLSPAEAPVRLSSRNARSAIVLLRDNVTVRGIAFRNFAADRHSSAIRIGPNLRGRGRDREGVFTVGTVVDSCAAENCWVGFHVNVGSDGARISHARVRNCVTGVYVSGVDTVVEHCRIVNDPDWREKAPPDHAAYNQAGVRLYNGPEDGVFRYNFIRGHLAGFSSKGSPGRYVFEFNTVVDAHIAVVPDPTFHVRHNIFTGVGIPFRSDGDRGRDAEVDRNLFWGPRDLTETITSRELGGGPENVFADPLFASPGRGDYRLLPDSPALRIPGAEYAGAFPPVPDDYQGPPNLRVTLARRRNNEAEAKLAVSSAAPARAVRFAVDGGPARERAFEEAAVFELPTREGEHTAVFQVQDANGVWSDEAALRIPAPPRAPRMVGEPRVVAGRFGALFSFEADAPAWGTVEYHDGNRWVEAGRTRYAAGRAEPVFVSGLPADTPHRYRIAVHGTVKEGAFALSGRPKIMYVSTAGEDSETGGSRERPFATIQFALDRALPGDRVRVMPGVYFGENVLDRGGTEERPIVIEGLYPNTATLDGRREAGTLLRLGNAPRVVVRNLNFRWFLGSGLVADASEGLRVSQCRFHNQYWRSSANIDGRALVISRSPNFLVDRNIFTRCRYGLEFRDSPGGRVFRNTATAGAVTHLLWRGDPSEGVAIEYNSFNWNGNQLMNIQQPLDILRDRTAIDFNNYGTTFRQPGGTADPRGHGKFGASLDRPFPYLPTNREFMIANRAFVNMEDWREYTGQDANSIFADPKWIDPRAGRFDVAADSPNLLPDGRIVGALGYLGEDPNMEPEAVVTTPYAGEEIRGAFAVEADASDFDGVVERVRFYAGDKLLGEAAAPPYRIEGATLPPGSHVIRAEAVDDRGATGVSDDIGIVVLED